MPPENQQETTSTVLICDREIHELHSKPEGSVTEGELLELLRKYNIRDGLIVLGKLSNFIFTAHDKNSLGKSGYREPITGIISTQFALAYLANAIILSGANDYKAKQLGDKQNLLVLCNLYGNGLVSPEMQRNKSIPFDETDLASAFVRMWGEQFEYQFDTVLLISRNIVIFTETIKKVLPTKFEELEIIFQRETGLTFREYFFLAMAVFAAAQSTATFRKEVLTEAAIPSMRSLLTDEKVTAFLDILSADYVKIREEDARMNGSLDPVLTKYRFNPLDIYPIIQTDRTGLDPYVIPNIITCIKRAFGGLYWWFHRHFEAKGNQQDFRNYFGEVFEQYVGMLLKQIYGEGNVHPEIIYPKGKFIDWWVEHNGKIYLFEAKAYQFALRTKQTGSQELVHKEVVSKVVQSVEQVFNRISEIDTYDELAVLRGKEIIPIIVFMDMPFISSNLYKKPFLDKEIEKLESSGLTGIKAANIHFLNVEELELYHAAIEKIPLEEVFARYKDNPAEGFTSIIAKVVGKRLRNPYLDKIYKDMWNDMTGGAPTNVEDDAATEII